MADMDAAILYHEYSDAELPDAIRTQVLDFLRIVWPEGFAGPNRFRDWTTPPEMHPHHLLYAADRQLVSHLEVITASVSVNDVNHRIASLTAALTFPAFRGEGWSSRLNAKAAKRIDGSGADIGILTCDPDLIDFYSRVGWIHVVDASILVGPHGATWTSGDVLLARPTSPKSLRILQDLNSHPLRVADEW